MIGIGVVLAGLALLVAAVLVGRAAWASWRANRRSELVLYGAGTVAFALFGLSLFAVFL